MLGGNRKVQVALLAVEIEETKLLKTGKGLLFENGNMDMMMFVRFLISLIRHIHYNSKDYPRDLERVMTPVSYALAVLGAEDAQFKPFWEAAIRLHGSSAAAAQETERGQSEQGQ